MKAVSRPHFPWSIYHYIKASWHLRGRRAGLDWCLIELTARGCRGCAVSGVHGLQKSAAAKSQKQLSSSKFRSSSICSAFNSRTFSSSDHGFCVSDASWSDVWRGIIFVAAVI